MTPDIVFCTTCKGRAKHIEQTLPENLSNNKCYKNCKFVILDYGDSGELRAYLNAFHADSLASGRVVLYTHPTSGAFHMAHAKNMAARCGILEGADILVTLDADNFTGPCFARYIAAELKPGAFLCPNFPLIHSMPHGPARPARGYAGRLAIRSQDFIKAGGYDEIYDTWRGEDIDMICRLERMGYALRHIDNRFLNAVRHDSGTRFREYPHAQKYETDSPKELEAIASRKETVVNYGTIGLGVVYRNYDPAPRARNFAIRLTAVPTRVFGIGMHKTATTSLDHAFRILGMDSFHFNTGNEARMIWEEMNSLGRSITLERSYALCDLPIPLLYKQMDHAYPGSRFILTLRGEAAWLKSVERMWDPKYNQHRWTWDVYPFSNRIHRALYGRTDFDPDVFIARYRKHNADVLEYFKGRKDLLVMNMDAGAGWRELCGFLDMDIPQVPYPSGNQTRPAASSIAALARGSSYPC